MSYPCIYFIYYLQGAPIKNNPLEKKLCISAIVAQIWTIHAMYAANFNETTDIV